MTTKFKFAFVLTLNFIVAMGWSLTSYADKPLLIISAMKMEYLPIVNALHNETLGCVNKIPFAKGNVGHTTIVAAYTGIGSVNAGIITATLINKFHPKGVIFTGVAGSLQPTIHFGDVVASTNIFSVNFGQYTKRGESFEGLPVNPVRRIKAPLAYPSNKRYISVLKSIQKNLPFRLLFGSIASDQHFPFNKLMDNELTNNKVAAVAMEDIGTARACWLYNTPMISIRGISDNIYLKTKYTRKKAAIVAKRAAMVTIALIRHLND